MSKVETLFNKIWQFLKKFHWYGWLGIVIAIGFQSLCYFLSHIIAGASGMSLNPVATKIDAIDNCFPVIPFFIIFYCLTFPFWGFAVLAAALTDKRNFINFLFTSVIASAIGFIILTALPTEMNRVSEGIIDIINKPGFLNWLFRKICEADGGLYAYNLLPSFHCMTTMTVVLSTFRRKDSPLWWRITSVISLILIALSTLFTKQHYFLDVITGLSIPIVVHLIIKLINPGDKIIKKHEKKAVNNTISTKTND